MLNSHWRGGTMPCDIKNIAYKSIPEARKSFKSIFVAKIQSTFVSLLTGLMVGLMLGMPSLSLAQRSNPMLAKAIAEAELNAMARTNTFSWFVLGYVGGPITFAVTAFYKPPPPAGLLLGKSPGYVEAYTKAYKAKARSLRFKYATIGLFAGIATAVVVWTAYDYGTYGTWWWTTW